MLYAPVYVQLHMVHFKNVIKINVYLAMYIAIHTTYAHPHIHTPTHPHTNTQKL